MLPEIRTRRSFMKTMAASSAAGALAALSPRSYGRVIGANDRISIGVIGCGMRASGALMPQCRRFGKEENAEITAICDPWNQQRATAVATGKEWYGREPRAFANYADLLALEDVDAVIIACPDHLHARVLAAAARAGKDAYCEKPLAMEMDELIDAVDAVKAGGRVVQAGTQMRSEPAFTAVRELVRAGGLGKVFKCEETDNHFKPYWHSYEGRSLAESDTDWKAFLGHRPYRPFDADQYSCWMGYRDFSSGSIGGYMSHWADLVHYITGAQFPWRAVALGGTHVWKDKRDVPDSIEVTLEYKEGMIVHFSTTFGNGQGNSRRIFGTRGTADILSWNTATVTGEGSDDPDRIEGERALENIPMTPHMQNWLQCLRSRKAPHANIEAGYAHAVACILADRAWVEGRRLAYDPERRAIVAG